MKNLNLLILLLILFQPLLNGQEIEEYMAYQNRIVRYCDGNEHWFVDTVANKQIGSKYIWAQCYDSDGLAKVKKNGNSYLLNTEGQEFEYTDQLEKINTSTSAFIFQGQTINGRKVYDIPKELFKHTQLKVLIIDAKATVLPEEIANLTNLESLIINAPLNNIPKEFANLTNLKVLSLSSYKGESLPAVVGRLKNLIKLTISGYNLNSLPVEITQLTKLESLKISLNAKTIIDLPTSMQNLINLESFYISGGYEQVPKVVAKLSNLKRLYLDCSMLKNLPEEMSALKKMEYLDLARAKKIDIASVFKSIAKTSKKIIIDTEAKINYNTSILRVKTPKFKILPAEIKELKNLVELKLEFIKEIPSEIGGANKLNKMIIASIESSSLPTEICNLSSLEVFSVNRSNINGLPAEFSQLQKLKIFELKSSKLNEFPKELLIIKSLKQIDLYKNDIKSIPPEIKELINLNQLVLSGNKNLEFDTICSAFENTTKKIAMGTLQLKYVPFKADLLIALDYNKKITPGISGLKTISVLEINVDTEETVKAIGVLPDLKYLKIKLNQMDSFPEEFWNLKSLESLSIDIGSKEFVLAPEISKLKRLKSLKIKGRGVQKIPNSICNLKTLESLDLKQCALTEIPARIGKLKNLSSLDIAWNSLIVLPKSIKKLKKLEFLDLSGNKIKHLPKEITKMKQLKDLKVQKNPLVTLPVGMKNLTNLTFLNLEGMKDLDFISVCNAFIGYTKDLEITTAQHASNTKNEKLTVKAKCYLDTLPVEIGKLTCLTSFFQSSSPIKTIPNELANLKALKYFQIMRLPKEENEKAKALLPKDCVIR